MKETWINDIQQKLADYEQPAPELAWDEIEQAVGKTGDGGEDTKGKALTLPIWRYRIVAAVLCLLVTGSAVYFYNRKADDVIATVANTKRTVPTVSSPTVSKQTVAIINKGHARLNPVRTVPTVLAETSVQPEPTIQPEPADEQPSQPTPTDTLTPFVASAHIESVKAADTQYDSPKPSTTPNRLTAKVFLGNTLASSDGPGLTGRNFDKPLDYYSDPISQNTITDGTEIFSGLPGLDPALPFFALERTETRHHQPVRLGLLLRHQIAPRWALEAGLTYTRLTADITRYTNNRITATADQSLNYIGIPVSLSYQLWQHRPLAVYASFGGMVEKMVAGSLRENGETTSLTIRPLQFSLNGAVGAELRLAPWLNLFAEPGINYYFDNGSTIETLYQDKPLNLHLNLGLRFEL